jgi:hypothetical protein
MGVVRTVAIQVDEYHARHFLRLVAVGYPSVMHNVQRVTQLDERLHPPAQRATPAQPAAIILSGPESSLAVLSHDQRVVCVANWDFRPLDPLRISLVQRYGRNS